MNVLRLYTIVWVWQHVWIRMGPFAASVQLATRWMAILSAAMVKQQIAQACSLVTGYSEKCSLYSQYIEPHLFRHQDKMQRPSQGNIDPMGMQLNANCADSKKN